MTTDLHTLSGAFALDALSADDAFEFFKHLDECPACHEEVAELREVAAKLGASAAVSAPPDLRSRVLSAADREPQLPPLVSTSPQDHVHSQKWLPRILAAAAALVAIAVGGVVVDQLNDPEATLAADVARVFDADDASTQNASTTTGATVSVATSASLGRMAVDTDELPALSGGQVYQLWTMTGETARSRGVLSDPDDGASMRLPGAEVSVAITIEPKGGSEQPTTEPIVSVVPSEV